MTDAKIFRTRNMFGKYHTGNYANPQEKGKNFKYTDVEKFLTKFYNDRTSATPMGSSRSNSTPINYIVSNPAA